MSVITYLEEILDVEIIGVNVQTLEALELDAGSISYYRGCLFMRSEDYEDLQRLAPEAANQHELNELIENLRFMISA